MKNINFLSVIFTCVFITLSTLQVSGQLSKLPDLNRDLDSVVIKLEDAQDDMEDTKLRDLREEKEENTDLKDIIDKIDKMKVDVDKDLDNINDVKKINIWDHADNITLNELRYIHEEIELICNKGQDLAEIEKYAARIAEELVAKYDMDTKSPRDTNNEGNQEKDERTSNEPKDQDQEYLAEINDRLSKLMEEADSIKAVIFACSDKIMKMVQR